MNSSIRAAGVTVQLGDVTALRDVTMHAAAGQVTALAGANGSGKSTLLGVLAGVVAHDGAVQGRARTAFVAQRSAVPDGLPLTVHDVVSMGRWSVRGSWRPLRAVDRDVIAESLDAVHLSSHAGRSLGELSGGQHQRAFVAQALAHRAELLLLDEPTAGVDAESTELILAALEREAARGAAVVHATHDRDAIARADHVIHLHEGRVVAQPV
jgi:zinc/manganese transport system ATP-binding protein